MCVGASGGEALSWGWRWSTDSDESPVVAVWRRENREEERAARARRGEADMSELAWAISVSHTWRACLGAFGRTISTSDMDQV